MKFKVGDTVWWARCRWEPVKIPCDTCFGKLEVTLILGNGDKVVLPCDACGKGYIGPRGYMDQYKYVIDPELVTITGMEVQINGEKEEVRYRSGSLCYDEKDLFASKDDAALAGVEKKRLLGIEQETKSENIKQDVHKTFSWNAAYHLREVKTAKERIAYHEKKARLCKERVKK